MMLGKKMTLWTLASCLALLLVVWTTPVVCTAKGEEAAPDAAAAAEVGVNSKTAATQECDANGECKETTVTTTEEAEEAVVGEETVAKTATTKPAVRIVTEEELATKTGEDGGDIWISIMGEVYDVSNGRDYYAPGSSYSAFAGKEGSVPFVTGVFTEEELKKGLKHLTDPQLKQLDQWRSFYAKEEKYPFVGFLQGRYYDENGKPTKSLRKARKRMLKQAHAEAKAAALAKYAEYLKQQQAEKEAAGEVPPEGEDEAA